MILSLLTQQPDGWLVGYDNQTLLHLTEQALQDLEGSEAAGMVLLADPDPIRFLARFLAACSTGRSIVLANPNWAAAEWEQVWSLVSPDLIWADGDPPYRPPAGSPTPSSPAHPVPAASSLILIPTGGSSGKIRFAMHTWETLTASVAGFQEYFEIDRVNSFCVLPLYHVSGLMQCLRSLTSGGRLVILPFRAVTAGEWTPIAPEEFFLSLVPTQLQRLLPASPTLPWLARFQTVLLGGAPAWPELLAQARDHRIRLAPTYGMTETASQIATLKPDDFLRGQTGCGQILPHATVTIRQASGEGLPAGQTGAVTIAARSLALGYYPHRFKTESFQPDDLGFFDAQGYLHLVGRTSDKIITGGENVFPSEVEAAIRATGLVADACVIGLPDRHWGQAITAIYVPSAPDLTIAALQTALNPSLSKFKQPKHWIAVEQLPRNAQGKTDRSRLVKLAAQQLSPSHCD